MKLADIDVWAIGYFMPDGPGSMPTDNVIAWEVQPDPDDPESVALWSTECVLKARVANNDLELLTPILAREVGGWLFERFRVNGCDHCKRGKVGAILKVVLNAVGNGYYIVDGANKMLVGLRSVNRREAPIAIPKDFKAMSKQDAEVIKQTLRAGYAVPIFR
jgi:hypothetical protein